MKEWKSPAMEELDVKATQYSPDGGIQEDGAYISYDGKYTITTYGPSTGNAGEPTVGVN